MLYEYKCTNEKCENYDKVIDIYKPMKDSSREEHCEKCEKLLERVYGVAGHQTFGDGYKG